MRKYKITFVFATVTSQNVDKPKRRQPKRRPTETSTNQKRRQTKTFDKPTRRQTKTSTNQTVDAKRRQTKTSTNRNVDKQKRRQYRGELAMCEVGDKQTLRAAWWWGNIKLHLYSLRLPVKTSTNRNVDNQNVDKPKRQQTKNVDKPKRLTSRHVNKPERRRETSTDQNVDKPKRRQIETSTT